MSQIIRRALKILESRMTYGTDFFTSPNDTKNYLRLKLGGNEREVFAVMRSGQDSCKKFRESGLTI